MKVSKIGIPAYSYDVVKSIPLEPANDAVNPDDVKYETRFIALGVHQNEYLYAVTHHGDAFFLTLEDLCSRISEETLEEAAALAEAFKQKFLEKQMLNHTKELENENIKEESKKQPVGPIKVARTLPDPDFDSEIPVLYLNLKRTRLHGFAASEKNTGLFAYGGENEDLRIATFEKELNEFKKFKDASVKHVPTVLFEGKNVKNDRLDLKVPISISNVAFLNDQKISTENFKEGKPKLELITTTHYGEVRKYDTSHGRKPTANFVVFPAKHNEPNKKPKIFCLGQNPKLETELIVSDDHNSVVKYSITLRRAIGKFQGPQGAVYAIACGEHDGRSIAAIGGLDKYLRVYDFVGKNEVSKVFLKSKISALCLFEEEEEEEKEGDDSGSGNESDSDELWEKMEDDTDEEEPATKRRRKD